jgi:hypothetical protein
LGWLPSWAAASLLVLVADLRDPIERGAVLGAGVVRLAGGGQDFAEAVERADAQRSAAAIPACGAGMRAACVQLYADLIGLYQPWRVPSGCSALFARIGGHIGRAAAHRLGRVALGGGSLGARVVVGTARRRDGG